MRTTKYNLGLNNWKWGTEIYNSESLNNAHCTSSLGSLKDIQGYCYNSFTYFSPLIFLVYSLHAPASCIIFLVYILIFFYRLSFLSCTALLFLHSLMHSTAQSCIGNGTGIEYPGVSSQVWLGLGYRLVILYPSETHTHDAGTWVQVQLGLVIPL